MPTKLGEMLAGMDTDDIAVWLAQRLAPNPRPDDTYAPDEESCVRCRGAGYLRPDVPATDPSFGHPVPCSCAVGQACMQRAIVRRFGDAGLPPEYRAYAWRDHPDRVVVGMVNRWLADPKDRPDSHHWLLISGGNGVGKTTLAGGLAADLAEAGQSVLFRTGPELLADIRATFGNTEEQEALRQTLRRVRYLFLDDLATEVPRDWVGEFLYEVLTHRHNHHLPTIITTNLDRDEMAEYFGPRIWGRVKRMAEPIEMTGPDLRDIPHAH